MCFFCHRRFIVVHKDEKSCPGRKKMSRFTYVQNSSTVTCAIHTMETRSQEQHFSSSCLVTEGWQTKTKFFFTKCLHYDKVYVALVSREASAYSGREKNAAIWRRTLNQIVVNWKRKFNEILLHVVFFSQWTRSDMTIDTHFDQWLGCSLHDKLRDL